MASTKHSSDRLIDKAFNICNTQFKNETFTTSDIWKLLEKQEKLSNENGDDYINFYVDLLQDPRFVAIGTTKWKLRDYVSVEEFEKLANSKYSNVEYGNSEDKGDEEIIDELIDEEIDDAEIQADDDDSKEYQEEQIEDSEIDELDEEETEEENEENDN